MILSALNDYYNRLQKENNPDISPMGYSVEKISYAIVLDYEGNVIAVDDIRDVSDKIPKPKNMIVPQSVVRSSGISPNFLWDKSSYVLGVSKNSKRSEQEHSAFVDLHREKLKDSLDEGLKALLKFLDNWESDIFNTSPIFMQCGEDFLDANIVFRVDNDKIYLHEREHAQTLQLKNVYDAMEESKVGRCLITGLQAPIARLHPPIKGVRGAQSSGAAIVSFNLDAFTSYRKRQGENAPISEVATFKYVTALNYLLRTSNYNRQRIILGDTTVVFWAESEKEREAEYAENLLAAFLSPEDEDQRQTERLRSIFELIRQGKPIDDEKVCLNGMTRMFILGLAPNASRLSIRFWVNNTLNEFAKRLAQHYDDLALSPSPWKIFPSIWRLLLATAPTHDGKSKSDDIPPNLSGELTRSILTGSAYPQNLLGVLLMRLRSDKDISGIRVALIKGILNRNYRLKNSETKKGGLSMSLDTSNKDVGYLIGRLFASLENIQRNALGRDVNATIRDRYFGAASATPASIFPMLIRNAQNHLGKIRKEKPGLAVNLEKEIGEIINMLGPKFPKNLSLEMQGHFAIGYYHQIKARYAGMAALEIIEEEKGDVE